MMALVSMGIRPGRRPQQGQSQDIPLRVVSVFAVVQDAQSVFCVRQVSPVLSRDLELSLFFRRISGGGPFNRTEGDFVGCNFTVDADGERDFQEDVFLVPIHLRLYVYTLRVAVKGDVLNKGRVLEMMLHAHDSAQWAGLDQLHFVGLVDVPELLFKIGVDVPGVILFWFVNESLKKISAGHIFAATGICFRWSQRFLTASLVE